MVVAYVFTGYLCNSRDCLFLFVVCICRLMLLLSYEPLDDTMTIVQHVARAWREHICLTRPHVHSALDMKISRNRNRKIPIVKGNNVGISIVSKATFIMTKYSINQKCRRYF